MKAIRVVIFVLFPVLTFGQSDEEIIGVGGAAGVSVTSSQMDVGNTFRISAFLDKKQEHSNRFIRLQGDLGTWSAERKSVESYGIEETQWRLIHFSVSAHLLLGSDNFIWAIGLGSSLFLVHETETVRYAFEEKESSQQDELKTSSVSFGLLPTVGMIIPLSYTTEIALHLGYDFVMHPVHASRLSIMVGLYFLLN